MPAKFSVGICMKADIIVFFIGFPFSVSFSSYMLMTYDEEKNLRLKGY